MVSNDRATSTTPPALVESSPSTTEALTSTANEPDEPTLRPFEADLSTRAFGPDYLRTGIYVSASPVRAADDWCTQSTPVWHWVSDDEVEPSAFVPGAVMLDGQAVSSDVVAVLTKCLDQEPKYGIHMVYGSESETIEIPTDLEWALFERWTGSTSATTFGRLEVDVESRALSVVEAGSSFDIPGRNGLRVETRPVAGQAGCEQDGVGHEAVVVDESGSVVAQLWVDNGPTFASDAFTFASDGFFVANRGTCGEGLQHLFVGKINIQTEALDELARLCELAELRDNDLSDYGFDVALVSETEITFWKAGLEQGVTNVTLSRDALPVRPPDDADGTDCAPVSMSS